MKGPYLPDILTMVEAGIDPFTGKPIKAGGPSPLNQMNKVALRIMDEQDAVNRYQWFNLPDGLDGELIERILYYRYTGIFFYKQGKFYFLPYAPKGVDVYGRYTGLTPIPFNGSTGEATGDSTMKQLIGDKEFKPVWGIKLPEELTLSDLVDSAVVLNDYCKQISQKWFPRWMLNDPVIQIESDCLSYLRTAMIASSGIKGMLVESGDDKDAAREAGQSIKNAALSGDIYVPIQQSVKIQELVENGSQSKFEEFLMAMQSLDNFRLSLYGLDSGGVFEKKAHVLETESMMNRSRVALIYQDGLTQRQKFCDIVNSIWGLSIWVEPSEAVLGQDINGDGVLYDISNNINNPEVKNNEVKL